MFLLFLIAFLVILLAGTLLFLDLGPWALERSDLTERRGSGVRQPPGLFPKQFLTVGVLTVLDLKGAMGVNPGAGHSFSIVKNNSL